MAPDPDRLARRLTFALMAVAYANCEVASYLDGRPRAFGVGYGVVVFALAAVASYLIPGPTPGRANPPARLTAALAVVLALPTALEPLLRSLAGDGFPLELLLVNGLRTLGLGLAAAAARPGCRQLAGVVALFLALFAAAMGDQPAMPYLLALFALTGGAWLVVNYRAGLGGAAAGVADGAVAARVGMRVPARELAVFGFLAAAAAGVAVAGPKRVVLALGELVPTSGGTGATDPFARSGVGDGPEETAGDDARAAGMVESDKLIEDQKDSLIDAVSDMYGLPHKPPKERDRMVAAGKLDVIQNHEKLPENRRPNRDFDTGRAGPKDGRPPDGARARAVIEVEGRTPLHIRVVTYDRYDPAAGRWAAGPKPAGRMIDRDPAGGDWMVVSGPRATGTWYAADDRHRLKVADLRDNLVPTPALLTRFRIRRVDRPEYYEWDHDGVLALAGRKKTPPGVVVQTDCRTLDPATLPAAALVTGPGGTHPAYTEVPAELDPAVGRLAREFAGDAAPGWPRAEAVLRRLRADYALDPAAAAPPGHPAPVLWFLAEGRRGPDYLFASAAALMLRSLGHPARVCLGYYAAPAAYDPETGHTPVRRTDLHVWPEVLLRDGLWLVVEPTPGYDVLPPNRSWADGAADAARAVGAWAGRNAGPLAAAAVLLAVLVRRRAAVWDAWYTAAWRLAPGPTEREAARRAVRLLERRTRLAGCPRPAAETLAGWAAGLRARAGRDDGLGDLIRLGEWAAYAPDLPPPVPGAEAVTVCRRALGDWTLARLRATDKTHHVGGTA